MASDNIPWLGSVDEARTKALGTDKLILIDLFNPK